MAAEETVRKYEHACEQFDFATANALLASDARWIEDSYPEPAKFTGRGWSKHWEEMKQAKVRLHYQIRDLETHISGDVAWITLCLDTVVGQTLPKLSSARGMFANGAAPLWKATCCSSCVANGS